MWQKFFKSTLLLPRDNHYYHYKVYPDRYFSVYKNMCIYFLLGKRHYTHFVS